MLQKDQHSRLFKAVCELLKYCLLGAAGFAIACILSALLGEMTLASLLLHWLTYWLGKLLLILTCLLAATAIYESLRH